jgi:hypothetical protein
MAHTTRHTHTHTRSAQHIHGVGDARAGGHSRKRDTLTVGLHLNDSVAIDDAQLGPCFAVEVTAGGLLAAPAVVEGIVTLGAIVDPKRDPGLVVLVAARRKHG